MMVMMINLSDFSVSFAAHSKETFFLLLGAEAVLFKSIISSSFQKKVWSPRRRHGNYAEAETVRAKVGNRENRNA